MTTPSLALQAAQGEDLYDLLNHIAWTDVLKPDLEKAKSQLTQQLVDATLRPQTEGAESREQIAGKLFGIQYMIAAMEKILKRGVTAKEDLARHNLFLQ